MEYLQFWIVDFQISTLDTGQNKNIDMKTNYTNIILPYVLKRQPTWYCPSILKDAKSSPNAFAQSGLMAGISILLSFEKWTVKWSRSHSIVENVKEQEHFDQEQEHFDQELEHLDQGAKLLKEINCFKELWILWKCPGRICPKTWRW